jgi:PPOX class probable F420-dependent enzyme
MAGRRDLIRMTDAEVDAFLAGRHTMSVATVGAGGRVHLVAMWYGFLDGNPAFETYRKSQKVLNLRRDPRVTVLVEDGEAYEQLRGVEIVGSAVIHEEPEQVMRVARDVVRRYYGVTDPADLEGAAGMLARKRVAVEIVPDRIVSWDHGKLVGAP